MGGGSPQKGCPNDPLSAPGLVRFPNCQECPAASWMGNPTLACCLALEQGLANEQQHSLFFTQSSFLPQKHEASLLAMIESVLILWWAGGGHWVWPSGGDLESSAAPNPLTSHFRQCQDCFNSPKSIKCWPQPVREAFQKRTPLPPLNFPKRGGGA